MRSSPRVVLNRTVDGSSPWWSTRQCSKQHEVEARQLAQWQVRQQIVVRSFAVLAVVEAAGCVFAVEVAVVAVAVAVAVVVTVAVAVAVVVTAVAAVAVTAVVVPAVIAVVTAITVSVDIATKVLALAVKLATHFFRSSSNTRSSNSSISFDGHRSASIHARARLFHPVRPCSLAGTGLFFCRAVDEREFPRLSRS